MDDCEGYSGGEDSTKGGVGSQDRIGGHGISEDGTECCAKRRGLSHEN